MIKDYVAFDLETTGLKAETDYIIEIGALKVRNGVQMWMMKTATMIICLAWISISTIRLLLPICWTGANGMSRRPALTASALMP